MIPEELKLYPSRRKHIRLAAVSGAFVSASFWIPDGSAAKWWVAVFFGVCLLVFLTQLVPGVSNLRLTSEGFIVRSLMRNSPIIRWSEVSPFVVVWVQNRKMVVYDSQVDRATSPGLAEASTFLVGASSGLPDTYGMSAEDLATLMNEWRYRYADPNA